MTDSAFIGAILFILFFAQVIFIIIRYNKNNVKGGTTLVETKVDSPTTADVLEQKLPASQTTADNSLLVPQVADDQVLAETLPISYLGCANDSPSRVYPNAAGVLSIKGCYNAAKKAGSKYFGLEYRSGGNGRTAECWHGNESRYDKYGKSGDCVQDPITHAYMGDWWNMGAYEITDMQN